MPLIKTSSREPWGRAALILALAAVGGAPLAVGAVHPPMLLLFTALSFLALGFHVIDRARAGRRVAISWLLLPFGVGLASAFVHVLPLPLFLRQTLAPEATELLEYIRATLPGTLQTQVRGVLTLDVAATAQSFLRLASAACVFVVLADRSRERRDRRLIFRAFLGFGAALFLVSVAHRITNADLIYGLFPPNGKLPLFGPLINPNHLARAFGVFAVLLIGRGLQVRSRTEAALFLLTGVLCACGVFATISRGGIAALVVGLLCGLALYLWAKRRETGDNRRSPSAESSKVVPLVVALLSAAIVVIVGTMIWDRLAFEAGREISVEGTKLQLIPVGLRLLDAHWAVGVGSGAFEFGVPQVIQAGDFSRELTVVFAENIIVETLTTHGLVVGSLLFVLALVGFTTLFRDLRVESAFPIGAVVFLFVGELFDFAFEVSFGALLAAAALAVAAGPTLDVTGKKVATKGVAATTIAVAAIAVLLSVIAVTEENRSMEQVAFRAKGKARTAALLDGMAHHPFNAWYPYALAVSAREQRDAKGALKWANRALNLRPTSGGAHLEAARVFWALGKRDQAALEYRLAWENQQGNIVVNELAARTNDLDLWTKAIPKGRPEALSQLCERLVRRVPKSETAADKDERFAAAQRCFERASGAENATLRVKRRALDMALLRGDHTGARRQLQVLTANLPPEVAAEYTVRLTALTEGADAARTQANALASSLKTPTPILRWILDDARRHQNYAVVHGTVARLRHHVTSAKDTEALDVTEIDAWMAEGETTKGMRLLSKLVRRHPRSAPLLLRLATTQRDLGLLDQARQTAKKVLRIAPKNQKAMRVLESLSVKRGPATPPPSAPVP